MDDLISRLRADAEATERATQMMADAKSARNQAAEGGEWPDYMGVKKENTSSWRAADKIEALMTALKPFAEIAEAYTKSHARKAQLHRDERGRDYNYPDYPDHEYVNQQVTLGQCRAALKAINGPSAVDKT